MIQPSDTAEHIANICESGERRRRMGGVIWLVVSAIAFAALLLTGAPRWTRALLFIPFALSAVGFLQARAKT